MIFSIHLVKDDWPYFLLSISIVVPISLSKIWPDLNWNNLQIVVGEQMLYNTPERKKKKKKSAERRFLNISPSLLDVWSYKKSLISASVTMQSATTGKLSNEHCEPDNCYFSQKSYLVIKGIYHWASFLSLVLSSTVLDLCNSSTETTPGILCAVYPKSHLEGRISPIFLIHLVIPVSEC